MRMTSAPEREGACARGYGRPRREGRRGRARLDGPLHVLLNRLAVVLGEGLVPLRRVAQPDRRGVSARGCAAENGRAQPPRALPSLRAAPTRVHCRRKTFV